MAKLRKIPTVTTVLVNHTKVFNDLVRAGVGNPISLECTKKQIKSVQSRLIAQNFATTTRAIYNRSDKVIGYLICLTGSSPKRWGDALPAFGQVVKS